MKDEEKSKEQLINELEEMRREIAELQRSASAGEALEAGQARMEEEAKRQTQSLAAVSELAIQCAAAPRETDILELIAEKIKSITGALATSIATYDAETRELTIRYIAVRSQILSGVNELLGRNIIGMRTPISPDLLKYLLSEAAIISEDLSEVSFGAIPELISAAIQKTFGIGSFTCLALRYGGELVGTIVVVMPKEQAPLPLDVAKTLAHMAAATLRRKRTEDALRESEERYRAVSELTSDFAYAFGLEADGSLVAEWMTDSFTRITGFTVDEAGSHGWVDIVHPDDMPFVFERMQAVFSGLSDEAELRIVTKDKKVRWLRVHSYPVWEGGPEGRVVRIYGAARDITERKQTERALRESQERFLTVLDSIDAHIYAADMETYEILFMNKHMQDDFGSNLVGEICWKGFRGESGPCAHCTNDKLLDADGNPAGVYIWEGQNPITGKWYINYDRAIKWVDGRLVRLQIATDITERVRVEESLRDSEEKYRDIVELAPDGIATANLMGVVTSCNTAFLELTGFSEDEIVGKHVSKLPTLRLRDLPEYVKIFRSMMQGKVREPVEFIWVHKDGTPRWGEARVTLMKKGSRVTGLHSIIRDITEQKRAEKALRRRNRELAMLNRTAQAFSSSLDLDQVLTTVLEEVRQILGVTACSAWLIDLETDELVCRQTTEPRGEMVRGWRLAPGQGVTGCVVQHGESMIVPDTQADERYFRGLDQQTGLEIRSVLSVPLQVKQRIIGVIHVADEEVDRFDTSDMILVESLASAAAIAVENAQLYESAKELHRQVRQDSETKAVLLREVNHRVGNNLTAILGLLSAERDHIEEVDQSAYQSIMTDLSSRVSGLVTVHRMLSASQWAPLQLSELTSRVIHSSLQMLPFEKYISVDVSPSPVQVTSDQAHNLALVINELATNTAKYAFTLGEGTAGTGTAGTGTAGTREARDIAHIAVRIALEDDGDTIRFEFRDDGPGYPDEILQLECCEVGMELVQNIVRHTLGGELSLRNDPGAVAIIRFKANE